MLYRRRDQPSLGAAMFELDLSRWNKVWLSKPRHVRFDHATGMIKLHGVRGYLAPGDVAYLFYLAAALPQGGSYVEVGSWMGLSGIVFANGLIAGHNLRRIHGARPFPLWSCPG